MEEKTTGNPCGEILYKTRMYPGVWDVCSGPICDWSAVYMWRGFESESSAGATLISGVILSFSPQGHALSESIAGQCAAESSLYSCHTVTTAPHGLSDGFTWVQTQLVLSPWSSYRPSFIPLLLDNISANRRLFSQPSIWSWINGGEENKQEGFGWLSLCLVAAVSKTSDGIFIAIK